VAVEALVDRLMSVQPFHEDILVRPPGWTGALDADGDLILSPADGSLNSCNVSLMNIPVPAGTASGELLEAVHEAQPLSSAFVQMGFTVTGESWITVDGHVAYAASGELGEGEMFLGEPLTFKMMQRQIFVAPHAALRVMTCSAPSTSWAELEPLIDEMLATWDLEPPE
jgi:hypothetical protein